MNQPKGSKSSGAAPRWIIGQRWISEMESELGLGAVQEQDNRRVTIVFNDGETVRIYTKENAPLRRIIFKEGDTIKLTDGRSLVVKSVTAEVNSLVNYVTSEGIICETLLSSANRITTPLERILSSNADTCDNYKLRSDILDLRYRSASTPVRGFVGGRVELIPHQLYIANEVSSRFERRIMLADEVGLGKTIEACLILHKLIVSGRVSQVLIIVPESMVHVWFVELLRKFNLLFTIIENCENDEDETLSQSNPFTDSSMILIGMNQLLDNEKYVKMASSVNWDMMIVDEAHHLVRGSCAFNIVETISKVSKDLFLLTATPQHFGEENHFARLQLLDPYRHTNYDAHCKEADEHRKIAIITGKVLDGISLDKFEFDELSERLHSESAIELLKSHNSGKISDNDRKQIVAEILDRQGIGRALFRNTRAVIGGFPERIVFIDILDATKAQKENVKSILKDDLENSQNPKKRKLTSDPRIKYLADLLKKTDEDKILVICRSKLSVFAVEEALKKEINVKTALFHEDLTLLQRDRNAAWFSEEDGARILICSEIGSEGRNFQFSHHLFLFDLPVNPELVEQRIGRLDRIGQKNTVKIYVPVLSETPEAFLSRWYHEGLGIFGATQPAAQETFECFSDEINGLLADDDFSSESIRLRIDKLIAGTKETVTKISSRLKSGRNRLLEQHSFRPNDAAHTVALIHEFDTDNSLKSIMRGLFHSRGILPEEFSEDTWNLLSDSQLDETFPGLNSSRTIVTFNRSKALHREDYEFLTIDHPAVTGGIDIFLSSETGNACFAQYKHGTETRLLMEALFVTECIAPPSLYIDRFLPPFVFKIIIDNKGVDKSDTGKLYFEELLENVPSFTFMEKPDIKHRLIPAMLKRAETSANQRCTARIKDATDKIRSIVGSEIERLNAIRKTNPEISDKEIALAQKEYTMLLDTVKKASPRLDAIRLIHCISKNSTNEERTDDDNDE